MSIGNLKTEEEVKEYLNNLHTEYRFGCYSEKNPEACHLLGDFYESIKKEFKESAKVYKQNCDERNHARSCEKYGGYALIGKACKKDEKVAFDYMKKSCELGNGTGCYVGGVVATSDQELETDRARQVSKGVEMLEKACNVYRNEKACFYLSGIYISGIKDYVEKDLTKAYKFSVKSCELGNPYACANVSQMHARGEGAERNEMLAESFKKRALELQKQIQQRNTLQFQQGIDNK